jgi:hypothetical protein
LIGNADKLATDPQVGGNIVRRDAAVPRRRAISDPFCIDIRIKQRGGVAGEAGQTGHWLRAVVRMPEQDSLFGIRRTFPRDVCWTTVSALEKRHVAPRRDPVHCCHGL